MAEPQIKEDDTFSLPKKVVVETKEPEIEIEIVDDTPPEDQGKVPFPETKEGDDKEGEHEKYSANVQKRIAKLTAESHDQRRKKEAAERQLNEASNIVLNYQNELVRLRNDQQKGEIQALKEAEKRVENDLAKARTAYKAAVDSGDADQQADAQEALATAAAERSHIARVMPPEPVQPVQPAQPVQPQYQQPAYQQPQPPLDPKTTKWVQSNPWFEADGEEDKTFLAYGIHYKMVGEGFDPRTDEYYEELNSRLKAVYPNIANGETPAPKETRRKAPQKTVVASAQREPGTPTKVRLTKSEVDLARKFGVTNEDFAKEKLRLAALEEQGI